MAAAEEEKASSSTTTVAMDIFEQLERMPEEVHYEILHRLSTADVAALACAAKRAPPLAALLVRLELGRWEGRGDDPKCCFLRDRLGRCVRLQELVAQSEDTAAWRAAVGALRRARLPALRRVEVAQWSSAQAADFDALAAAMGAQAPRCRLALGVAERTALAALAARCQERGPLPRLRHLDVNLSAMPKGGEAQIVAIAESMAAEAAAAAPQAGDAAGEATAAEPQAPPPQPPPGVAVWVTKWGGCKGLPLARAWALVKAFRELEQRQQQQQGEEKQRQYKEQQRQQQQQRERALPVAPRLVGLESLNCTQPSDVLRVRALLPGLTALGLNVVDWQRGGGSGGGGGGAGAAAAHGAGDAEAEDGPVPLAALLRGAAPALRHLAIHGSAGPAGWDLCGGGPSGGGAAGDGAAGDGAAGGGGPCADDANAAHGHQQQAEDGALAALSRLTRLSLLSDYGGAPGLRPPAGAGVPPLPLAPLVAGARLWEALEVLALDRCGLAAHGELRALGRCARLRTLTLNLTHSDSLPWRLEAPPGVRFSLSSFLQRGVPPEAAAQLPPLSPSRPVSRGAVAPSLGDADLSWLRRLTRLADLTLEAPLLDFGWLPPSLERLDAAEMFGACVTWVRCSDGGAAAAAAAEEAAVAPPPPPPRRRSCRCCASSTSAPTTPSPLCSTAVMLMRMRARYPRTTTATATMAQARLTA